MTLLKGLALGLYGEPKSGKTTRLLEALTRSEEVQQIWVDNDSNAEVIKSYLLDVPGFTYRINGEKVKDSSGRLDLVILKSLLPNLPFDLIIIDPLLDTTDIPRLQQFAKDNNVLVIYVVNTK